MNGLVVTRRGRWKAVCARDARWSLYSRLSLPLRLSRPCTCSGFDAHAL